MKNKQKTKSPVGKSVLTLLCIGLAASLASIASVQAVIIDDFQSYTAGSNLLGQGPWLSTSPADTGVGITVEDIGGGVKVGQFADTSAATLGATLLPPIASGSNTIAFTARASALADPNDTSGFLARLDSGFGINSALDNTFQIGFSNGNRILWLANYTAVTGQTAVNSITVGNWYVFEITYDFTHTQGDLNTNYADFTVTDLASSTLVTSQSLSWANQNGGRTVLGAIDFLTGSTNADSTYQLDNIAFVPEPSSFALFAASMSGLVIFARRRRRVFPQMTATGLPADL
jgi:hypothetical protein